MNTGPTPAQRDAILARDWYACVRCGMSGEQIHHRAPRKMGGSRHPLMNSFPNLVLLCGSCHRWVESERDRARVDGFLLRSPEDGPFVPLALLKKRPGLTVYVRLTIDGRKEDLDEADVAYFQRYGQIPRKVE
jgi:hypothetical protein